MVTHAIPELEDGSNFDFLLLHMIGMDSAGHTYGSKHPEVTRKLKETESFIE